MDPRVTELHCIMPMTNIGSVMTSGILSYENAVTLAHSSIALQPVQDRRDRKQVPHGMKLHQYANLYFHARNPMLFKRLEEANDLCVLIVSTQILSLHGTVITDQNAASAYVRFLHPSQWNFLTFDDIYAMNWLHPGDQVAYWRHKARKCAEVLVPHRVDPQYLTGAHVVDDAAKTRLEEYGFDLPITVNKVLFFRS